MYTQEDINRTSFYGNSIEDALSTGTSTYRRDLDEGTKVLLESSARHDREWKKRLDEQREVLLASGATAEPLIIPIFKFLLVIAAVLAFVAALVTVPYVVVGAFNTPNTAGVDRQSLMAAAPNPDYYAALDPEADALSSTPSTTLLATHVTRKAAYTRWEDLTDTQQLGVQAIWLRYTRDPASFKALGTKDAEAIVRLLDKYLIDLGKQTGDPQPLIDRAHLFGEGSLAAHAGIEYSWYDFWGVSSFLEPKQQAWFMGSLILLDNPELAALSTTPDIMDTLKRAMYRGQDVHAQWKLANREEVDAELEWEQEKKRVFDAAAELEGK